MSINLALKCTVVCVAILAAYLYMYDNSHIQDVTKCVNIDTVDHIIFSKINNNNTMKCRNGCQYDKYLLSITCKNIGQNIYLSHDSFPYWKCSGIILSGLYIENATIKCASCNTVGNRYVHSNKCYIEYEVGQKNSDSLGDNENEENDDNYDNDDVDIFDGDAFIVTPSEKYSVQKNFLSVLLVAGMGFFTFFSMAFLRNRNIEYRE